jgi:hypothetical protein
MSAIRTIPYRACQALLSGLLLACFAVPAMSDGNLNCEAYAAAAVAQQKANKTFGCGFTGGRWSDNFIGHRNWCRSANVKMENLTFEDRARDAQLAQCQQQASTKGTECNKYADEAIAAQNKSKQLKCGYTGSRFQSTRERHFNWCMGADYGLILAEAKGRGENIQACETQKKAETACRFFAVAMKPLYPKANEACAGKSHTLDITINSVESDVAWCLQNGIEAGNQRVSAMNRKIADCEKL